MYVGGITINNLVKRLDDDYFFSFSKTESFLLVADLDSIAAVVTIVAVVVVVIRRPPILCFSSFRHGSSFEFFPPATLHHDDRLLVFCCSLVPVRSLHREHGTVTYCIR